MKVYQRIFLLNSCVNFGVKQIQEMATITLEAYSSSNWEFNSQQDYK